MTIEKRETYKPMYSKKKGVYYKKILYLHIQWCFRGKLYYFDIGA
jgi:hypothetical protein